MSEKYNYEYKIIDKNIGYFKFYENAEQKDFEAAFENYIGVVTNVNVNKLIVAVEMKGAWNKVIVNVWEKTAELAEIHDIKKWGIVTPGSALRKITLKRIVKSVNETPNYDYFLSDSEKEVLDWIKKD